MANGGQRCCDTFGKDKQIKVEPDASEDGRLVAEASKLRFVPALHTIVQRLCASFFVSSRCCVATLLLLRTSPSVLSRVFGSLSVHANQQLDYRYIDTPRIRPFLDAQLAAVRDIHRLPAFKTTCRPHRSICYAQCSEADIHRRHDAPATHGPYFSLSGFAVVRVGWAVLMVDCTRQWVGRRKLRGGI